MTKGKERLWKAFYLCFGVIFLNLALRTVFLNYCFTYSIPWVLLGAAVWGGALAGFYWLLGRLPVLVRRSRLTLAAALALQLAVLVWMGTHLETVGNNDFGSVYHSAETWVLEGRFPEINYFSVYPNNMGAFLLLKDCFQLAHWLGTDRFFLVGLGLNLLSIEAGILGCFQLARSLWDDRVGLTAAFAVALWPPLYFWVAVFYTDMLTFGFGPWVLYLALRAGRAMESSRPKGMAWMAAAGLLAGLGGCIKATALIPLVAGCVWLALDRLDWKRWLPGALAAVLAAGAVLAGLQLRVNAWLPAENRQMALPAEHWVMMGLVGDGSYNHADYLVSTSIADPAQRKEYARSEIAARLTQRSPAKFLQFAQIKQLRSWGSGNADVSPFLEAEPLKPGIALQLGASYGEYHFVYQYASQSWQVVMLALLAAGAWLGWRRSDWRLRLGLCAGSVLGVWLFLLLWEAGQRYIINCVPLLAVLMGAAVSGFAQNRGHGSRRLVQKREIAKF